MKQLTYILGSLIGACVIGLAVYHLAFEPVLDNFIPDEGYFSSSSTRVCE